MGDLPQRAALHAISTPWNRYGADAFAIRRAGVSITIAALRDLVVLAVLLVPTLVGCLKYEMERVTIFPAPVARSPLNSNADL